MGQLRADKWSGVLEREVTSTDEPGGVHKVVKVRLEWKTWG